MENKRRKTTKSKKQWDTLFDYEITYHLKDEISFQSRFFKTETPEVALNSFIWSIKKNINNIVIDEFAKHNPYSQRKELLDIPKNII